MKRLDLDHKPTIDFLLLEIRDLLLEIELGKKHKSKLSVSDLRQNLEQLIIKECKQ